MREYTKFAYRFMHSHICDIEIWTKQKQTKKFIFYELLASMLIHNSLLLNILCNFPIVHVNNEKNLPKHNLIR